jgi:hypothetical protein
MAVDAGRSAVKNLSDGFRGAARPAVETRELTLDLRATATEVRRAVGGLGIHLARSVTDATKRFPPPPSASTRGSA